MGTPVDGNSVDPSDLAASGYAVSVVSMSEWVHRRVESVAFSDAATVRRRVSIDFTVQDFFAAAGGPEDHVLVPVAFLAKATITALDVRDSTGAAVPVLNTTQHAQLTARALHCLAHAVLAAELDVGSEVDLQPIDEILDRVVRGAPHAARRALNDLRARLLAEAQINGPLTPLHTSDFFVDIVEQFVDSFALVAVVAARPGERRVLKFSYDEAAQGQDARGRWERFTDRLGLTPSTFLFDLPGANVASSFHFEISVPDGASIAEGILYADGNDETLETISHRAGLPSVHLLTPSERRSDYRVQINIRASKGGWLRTSLIAVTLLALTLLLSSLRLDVLVDTKGASSRPSVDVAALLLAFTAVLAAIVVRHGEHALTSRLLIGARVVTMATIGLPFVAAWLLAFGPTGNALQVMWWSLAVVALAAMGYLVRVYIGPKLVTAG